MCLCAFCACPILLMCPYFRLLEIQTPQPFLQAWVCVTFRRLSVYSSHAFIRMFSSHFCIHYRHATSSSLDVCVCVLFTRVCTRTLCLHLSLQQVDTPHTHTACVCILRLSCPIWMIVFCVLRAFALIMVGLASLCVCVQMCTSSDASNAADCLWLHALVF